MPTSDATPIRLLLIDDHPVLLDSLAYYLSQQGQFEIVGKLTHGDHCVDCIEKYQPNVVVMDLSMPGLGIFERLRELHKPILTITTPAILILTSDLGELNLNDLINAGVRGYLPKDSDAKQLVAAISALAQGSLYLHDSSRAFLAPRALESSLAKDLSTRERQLLALMAQGCSNKEIALKLYLSTGTVKSYSSRLFEKLSVQGRTQAVLLAMRTGLIPPTQRAVQAA